MSQDAVQYRCLHKCGGPPFFRCPWAKKYILSSDPKHHYSVHAHHGLINPPGCISGLCPGFGVTERDELIIPVNADIGKSALQPRHCDMVVVFIPDPVLSSSAHEILNDETAFLHVAIENATPAMLLDLAQTAPGSFSTNVPKSVRADDSPRDAATTVVAMWEWSSLPLQLKEFGARVVGMPYNVFIGAMLDPISNAATFSALKSADLILGGPALNEDFSNPLYCIQSENDLDNFLASAQQLRPHTVMFPDPMGLLIAGQKGALNHNLDLISREMETFRPCTKACNRQEIISEPGTVYKRSFSARSDHVIINGHDKPVLHPSQGPGAPSPFDFVNEGWIQQAYLKDVVDPSLGELRVYVVNGEITRALQTCPWEGTIWAQSTKGRCLRLSDSSILSQEPPDHNQTWSRQTGVHHDATELVKGHQELSQFVLDVVKRLAELEKKTFGLTHSDLDLFCRVDVGVVIGKERSHYYVNEVERGLVTCLWGWTHGSEAASDIKRVASKLPGFVCQAKLSQAREGCFEGRFCL
ncbi:hypothetical protein K523DRAFT_358492 [Schizophyllum commune Tattone D]|nr:hypothetical protein K523DRAFT_358492 [Schizophyllum commune Tattone D]